MRRGSSPSTGAKSPLGFHNPLPVIEEDDDDDHYDAPKVPEVPEKSPRRYSVLAAAGTRANIPLMTTPSANYSWPIRGAATGHSRGGGSRPIAQETEKDTDSLSSWLAKRGGWYRFMLMVTLAICAIVALAVGLPLGLRQKNQPSSTSSPSSQEAQPVVFPAGSYAFTTALYKVTTDCTSNNNTFRCYPFQTYNQSRGDASATYFWVISQVSSSGEYQISAAPNPFVPQFANVSLTQLAANQPDERLTFSFSMHDGAAAVVPTVPLSSGSGGANNNNNNNTAATCYFNNTELTATIWTRRPAEFPANLTTPVSNGGGGGGGGGDGNNSKGKPMTSSTTFDNWPYAVQVTQSTRDVPDCRDAHGNRVGGDLGPPPGRAGECSCSYANINL